MKTIAATMLLSLAAFPVSQAAVIAVSGYTADGNYGLTSVTIDSTTYNSLVGSTATIVSPVGPTDPTAGWIQGTTPTLTPSQVDGAASGLNYRDGVVNIRSGSTYQFGRTILANDRIFLWDFGTGDNVTFGLVDSGGNVIGTRSISLTAANFGSDLVTFSNISYVQVNGNVVQNVDVDQQRGVSFQLADFTGTGDVSLATGIQVTANSNLDPSVVALAIPEPSTWLLLAASATGFVVFRRRRNV